MSNIKVGDEIEITSCLMNTYWYRGKVGQKFTVVSEGYNSFAVGDGTSFILKRDCKLVSHDNLKDMLTNGRRVKLRNGEMYTVIDRFLVKPLYNPITEELVGMAIDNVLSENLTHKYGSEYDVVNIYERYNNNVALYFCHNLITDLIWQREEKTAKQLQLEALQKQTQDVADAIKKLQDEE